MVSRAESSLRVALLVAVALAATATPTLGQGPGIEEYRRLIDERESEITRLEARLGALEQRGDSLSTAKREAEPGSAVFQTLSNEILASSQAITTATRQLRVLYEQTRDLKTELFLAYNREIPVVQSQIDELTGQGRTTENSLELRRLVATLAEYVRERERITAEIEEVEDDLFLPQLAFDPTDGPAQLRVKEAIARDAVDRIDGRIRSIEDQINKAVQRQRDLEEFRRLQDDIELWGDSQAAQGGSVIEEILSGRNVAGGAGPGDVFDDPDQRLQELQRRRLDLIERRNEYEQKADEFAQRRIDFYR